VLCDAQRLKGQALVRIAWLVQGGTRGHAILVECHFVYILSGAVFVYEGRIAIAAANLKPRSLSACSPFRL
jgi:hypothetical protein